MAAANPAGKPAAAKVRQADRSDVRKHEGFLRDGNYRWLWVALALCAVSIAGYLMIDAEPRPRGGTMYGYILGTIGALLIVWLSLFGIRKRAITTGVYSLKAWLSAHVYLGLSLLVIATLHAGFHFGWNVHTLAYALMLLVIVSGMFGVAAYAVLPQQLSANRGETTQRQWLETIRSLDSQLRDAAQPLDRTEADVVRLSTEQTDIGGSLWNRLTGSYPGCRNSTGRRGTGEDPANEAGDVHWGRERIARPDQLAAEAQAGDPGPGAAAHPHQDHPGGLAVCARAGHLRPAGGADGAHRQRLLLLVRGHA